MCSIEQGNLREKENVDQSVGFGVTKNTSSAHSKFSENTQAEKVVDRSGKPEERDSPNAQIRTLFNEQRKTIIAECCEKVSHHELLAAQAEHERRILQEELLQQQQQDFHEVHQQDLIKMKELQKFQNSTFDEFTKQKFIVDQKTIMELSGRLQELQNEVNLNDSKDFQDAESICSGNSHVTSPPGLFPRHPPFEGLLKPAFISQRQTEEPPNIRDTSLVYQETFLHIHRLLHQLRILRN